MAAIEAPMTAVNTELASAHAADPVSGAEILPNTVAEIAPDTPGPLAAPSTSGSSTAGTMNTTAAFSAVAIAGSATSALGTSSAAAAAIGVTTSAAGAASSLSSGVAAGAGATTPSALLAASLVRSRATYFERLSSGSRASTSGSTVDATPVPAAAAALATAAAAVAEAPPPTPRHSAMLSPHPLHPLAPHPLSRAGSGGSWLEDEAAAADGADSDAESVDTFFDKPSYTRYGNSVEMSAAASYARRDAPVSGPSGCTTVRERQGSSGSSRLASCSSGGGATAAAAAAGPTGSAAAGADPASPTAELAAMGGRGYVRSMSARFGRVSGGSYGGGGSGGGRGVDGLFDDLVAHVGALLASHPDAEAQMGMVQGLSDRLLQLHEECERLERKEDEVEHLRGVLRELTATRAEAIRLKVQMAESLNGLQAEYYKVLRSAQLAQSTAKQQAARASATRKQLGEAQAELGRHRRANALLRERNRRLRAENAELGGLVAALEGGRLGGGEGGGRRSACYMALMRAQAAVLY